jgi:hypothetical protein
MGGIFFRGKDTEFQFCLKQSFFTVRTEKGPPSAGCTEKSGMFWLPPHHNKQRDRHERSDSCSLVPHLTFKQKTSPLDTPFSRNVSSKLDVFALQNFCSFRCDITVSAVTAQAVEQCIK